MTDRDMIELRVLLTREKPFVAELLELMLAQCGIPRDKIVQEIGRKRTRISLFIDSRDKARRIKRKFESLGLKGVSLSFIRLKDSDWKTKWKRYIRPFSIAGRFRVIPLWKKGIKMRQDPRAVYLDTTLTFGTGTHPTTQMVAELIEKKRGSFKNFLDIGTGTGILSVIAARCGGREIWAIDIDKDAVRTARKNFRVNRCRPKYLHAVDFKRFRSKARFDFIAANLSGNEIIKLKKRIISYVRPGRFVAVSGISGENAASFRTQFTDGALRCIQVLKRKGWHAFLFRKYEV